MSRAVHVGTDCYHPLSCPQCQYEGQPCGNHQAGQPEHKRCTGTPGQEPRADVVEALERKALEREARDAVRLDAQEAVGLHHVAALLHLLDESRKEANR